MNKQVALELKKRAEEVAEIFSDPNRELNTNAEVFELIKIVPLSESTAAVFYEKSSEKKAIAFFYYSRRGWFFFFPTDSHILGMAAFAEWKADIEHENWRINFPEKEENYGP